MILTGHEQFEVRGYRQPACVKRLADMTIEQVLAVANLFPPGHATRVALYQWQSAMRRREVRL
jgi:hypothetical protein